jgi:hypothetical protein
VRPQGIVASIRPPFCDRQWEIVAQVDESDLSILTVLDVLKTLFSHGLAFFIVDN